MFTTSKKIMFSYSHSLKFHFCLFFSLIVLPRIKMVPKERQCCGIAGVIMSYTPMVHNESYPPPSREIMRGTKTEVQGRHQSRSQHACKCHAAVAQIAVWCWVGPPREPITLPFAGLSSCGGNQNRLDRAFQGLQFRPPCILLEFASFSKYFASRGFFWTKMGPKGTVQHLNMHTLRNID